VLWQPGRAWAASSELLDDDGVVSTRGQPLDKARLSALLAPNQTSFLSQRWSVYMKLYEVTVHLAEPTSTLSEPRQSEWEVVPSIPTRKKSGRRVGSAIARHVRSERANTECRCSRRMVDTPDCLEVKHCYRRYGTGIRMLWHMDILS
jgi:hypothetical protein